MLPPPGFDFPSNNSAEPEIEREPYPSRNVRDREGLVGGRESRGMGKSLVMEDRGSDFC
jgi:hypothetical protein